MPKIYPEIFTFLLGNNCIQKPFKSDAYSVIRRHGVRRQFLEVLLSVHNLLRESSAWPKPDRQPAREQPPEPRHAWEKVIWGGKPQSAFTSRQWWKNNACHFGTHFYSSIFEAKTFAISFELRQILGSPHFVVNCATIGCWNTWPGAADKGWT